MNRGKLLIVSGSAGSGKSTVLAPFKDGGIPPFCFSVSATTRPPRPGERDGRDYHFVGRDEFEKMIRDGEFLEYTSYNGNYYGTLSGETARRIEEGKIVILEIETDGAVQVMNKFPPGEIISIFIAPPDYAELARRLKARGTDSRENISERLEIAKREIKLADCYSHMLSNPTGAADEVTRAIRGICAGENPEKYPVYIKDRESFCKNFLAY